MSAVWFSLAVIGFSELNRWEFVCVIPAVLAHNHLPPYANILGWVNPTCIFNLARFVQVEYQVARKHVASIVADDYCTPRSFARSLHIAFHTCGIGCQPAFKHHVFVVQIQVHCGVIDTRSFVKIDVKTIVWLHLQRCLHARFREYRHRRVIPVHSLAEATAYFRQFALLCFLFLCVVIARKPPRLVVACHGKLRMFFFDNEIIEFLLLRKLVTKAHAIVVNTEANHYLTVIFRLQQVYQHFVIVVAYLRGFAPNRFPSFVERRFLCFCYLETVHQIGFFHTLAGVFALCQLQSKERLFNHVLLAILHRIVRSAVVDTKPYNYFTIRRSCRFPLVAVAFYVPLCHCHNGTTQQYNQYLKSIHTCFFIILINTSSGTQ